MTPGWIATLAFPRRWRAVLALLLATAAAPTLQAADGSAADRDSGVPGVSTAQLDPGYWIARARRADRTVLDSDAIAAQNAKLRASDPSVHALDSLPQTMRRDDVRARIDKLSHWPDYDLYDEQGQPVALTLRDELTGAMALDVIPEQQATRFGLVTRRALMRTFPTLMRVFNSVGYTDIDRFQENAVFPGTPVAILHASRDGRWLFVVSLVYQAWIESDAIAVGPRDVVLAYPKRTPGLVVVGATARTVFTPDEPRVSDVQLEMGVRVPLLPDWPASEPVNGQHPYTAHVIELPVRNADGSLAFAPALLPRTNEVAAEYLPLNQANVLRQSFKFLGERYGWGGDYNARDCSGFVSEVYRSFGVVLPRNTRDQAVSPALNRIAFAEIDGAARRRAIVRDLQVGDLVYIPGHVMMIIGRENGEPYVIHDTTGMTYRDATGALVSKRLNGVSVTPLLSLTDGDGKPMIDRITNIQRIRP